MTFETSGRGLEALQKELTSIRRPGLSGDSVRRHAAELLKTRPVLAEAHALGLSALELHLAAVNVVKCAIKVWVRDFRFRVILEHTLGIDTVSLNADPPIEISLKDRRINAMDDLVISRNSESHFDYLMDRAYAELAGVLLANRGSPCQKHSTQEDIAFAKSRSRALEFADSLANELELVSALGHVRELALRRTIAERLREHLPLGFSLVRRILRPNILVELRQLTTATLDSRYPADWSAADLLPPDVMRGMLDGDDVGLLIGSSSSAENELLNLRRFYELRRRSLELIVTSFRTEEFEGWPSLRGGGPTDRVPVSI